jgi:RHS repeat-associated protein
VGFQKVDPLVLAVPTASATTSAFSPATCRHPRRAPTVFSIGYDFHLGNGTAGADNGNVYNIYNYRDRSRDQSFTYDSLNRLLSAQNAGTNCAASTVNGKTEYWGNNYSYDSWGNLTTKSVSKCSAEAMSLWADGHNWAHAVSGTDYQYDAAGNMTLNATAPATAYSYDAENRITGAAGYTYTYDADGNRVQKSNGAGASNGTLYWYMTPGIIGESDLAGTMKSEYVFFNGERLARRDLPAGSVAYYFSDHLKTASVVTDAAGNIKNDSDFYPWGGELQFLANDSNHYKFTGKERDTESGLDYFGARYYSNGLGRFVTPDWAAKPAAIPYAEYADPQSLNLYSYVRNIPTSGADVDGHFWQELKNAVFSEWGCWCTDKQIEEKERNWLEKNLPGRTFHGKSYKDLSGDALRDAFNAGVRVWWLENSKRIGINDPTQSLALVPGITRMILLSKAQDPKLRNIINDLYKERSGFGDGGTADAVEYERATGQPVGGKFHSTKAEEYSVALKNLINSGKLNDSDKTIAQRLLDGLTVALTKTK